MVQSNANHEANQVITKEEKKTLGGEPTLENTTTKEKERNNPTTFGI